MADWTKKNAAQLDAPIGISGLFLCTQDTGETTFRTIKQKWKGGQVVLMAPVMNAFQQDIFLSIILLSSKLGQVSKPTHSLLPKGMKDLGLAEDRDVISMNISYAQLADVADKANDGRFRESVRDAIQMLQSCTVRGQGTDESYATSKLIDGSCGVGKLGIHITLCWRLALGILGKGIYGAISLEERQALPTEVGRVMHAWVNCTLGAKSNLKISEDKLSNHIFSHAKLTDRAERKRLQRIREAAADIGKLSGWMVTSKDGIFEFNKRRAVAHIKDF